MTLFEAVFLGLVQGLTEFLPVSSSGHLLAARFLFGFTDTGGVAFDAFLHLGTLCAVLVYFYRTWWRLFTGLFNRESHPLLIALAVGTVPAAVVGYVASDVVSGFFRTPGWLSISFLFTALVLWWFDRSNSTEVSEKEDTSLLDAVVIGFAQVIALVPGVSRSGVTIAAGRARGLSRHAATTFSFLLSAPIIFGAGIVSAPALVTGATIPWTYLFVGWLCSFVAGLLAIFWLFKIIERVPFSIFSAYLVGMALLVFFVGS